MQTDDEAPQDRPGGARSEANRADPTKQSGRPYLLTGMIVLLVLVLAAFVVVGFAVL